MQPERRLRAVLDANVLISGFIGRPESVAFRIVAHLRHNAFQLLVSAAIVSEYRDVLGRPWIASRRRVSAYTADEMLELMTAVAEWHEPPQMLFPGLREFADIPYLLTAIAGHADYLVSGDNHLLDLADDARLRPFQIVTPRSFLDKLESSLTQT